MPHRIVISGSFMLAVVFCVLWTPNQAQAATFTVTKLANTNDNSGTATILKDESGPTISINDVIVAEKTAATTAATFTVTLSEATALSVHVDYNTSDVTAMHFSDYTRVSGTLTFAAGQTTKTITVFVRGDALDEPSETLRVDLSNAVNATINDGQGLLTITDDDPAPTFSIADVELFEGTGGSKDAVFTVRLSAASSQRITVGVIPANGSAEAPGDYASGGTNLIFPPGQISKTFSVPIQSDALKEIDEIFYVLLSSPVNASIARGRAACTIFDDDERPMISIDNLSIGEGNSGQRVASFHLRLSAPSGQIVRVSYATVNGSAVAGEDYVAVTPTQVAFNTGQTVALARVLINGDALNEANETFLVNLSAPQNATVVDNQALGTILNDDSAPSLSIGDPTKAEGHVGTTNLYFDVSLSKASSQTITINFATANGTATTANNDYVARNGTLTFAPGSGLTRTITIRLNGDTVVEGDEALYVLLSGAVNASVSKGRGIGTIVNDDTTG